MPQKPGKESKMDYNISSYSDFCSIIQYMFCDSDVDMKILKLFNFLTLLFAFFIVWFWNVYESIQDLAYINLWSFLSWGGLGVAVFVTLLQNLIH